VRDDLPTSPAAKSYQDKTAPYCDQQIQPEQEQPLGVENINPHCIPLLDGLKKGQPGQGEADYKNCQPERFG
jgi:hypothetical protein